MTDAKTLSRWAPWVLLAAAAIALGTVYIAEYGFGYEPCVLCLYQRVPYAVIAALGLLALVLRDDDRLRWVMLAAGVVFLVGGGIAFYHVGVEQTWWTSAAPCGAHGVPLTSTADLFQALQKKAEKSCGDIDWTLFGVSMATYNVGVSLILAVGALCAFRRLRGA